MNKKLLIFFFIYIIIEGALRKWFLPEFGTQLFLVKDIILFFVFFFYVANKKSLASGLQNLDANDKAIWITFVIYLLFYGILINFDNLTIIGWRYYVISVPLILLFSFYFKQDLNKYSYYYLLLSLPILILGIYQYINPSDSVINKYAWVNAEEKIAIFGDKRPRITGTFSYISPYTIYLQTIFLLGWTLLLSTASKKKIFLINVVIFLSFINLILTGSRGPVIIVAILSIPFIYYYITKPKNKFGIVVILTGFVFLSLNLLVDPFEAFSQRVEKAGDTEIRVYGALLSPVVTLSKSDVIGTGIGKTFMGTIELSNRNPDTLFDEINQDRVGVELGTIGYLFVLLVKIYFLIKTFSLIKKVKIYEIKLWVWFSLSIQLSSIWAIPFYNSIAATFYFTAIGIYYIMLRKQMDAKKHKEIVKI
jgi:hypothetical protein